MRPIITLTTDFGASSSYVAQMKGVLLTLCRDVQLVDITHAIGPQNVREGAIVLADACGAFPDDAVHLAVVDPGVGTARKPICARWGGRRFVAPDNGLLSWLARERQPDEIRVLDNPQYLRGDASATFHGRDIFAPAAGQLALGVPLEQLGSRLAALHMLAWPLPRAIAGGLAGEVLYADSFGNLATNLTAPLLGSLGESAALTVACAGRTIAGIRRTYGEVAAGTLLALFDSQGRLEIAVAGGSAAVVLGVGPGEPVVITC